jgi:uncharacterized protein YegP (UPF0339 family)
MFTKHGYYKVTKNKEAKQPYHWVLKAPNHETILNSENYSSKQMALKGIASVREHSPYDENYERKVDKQNNPMFNLLAENNKVIGSSESYYSTAAREVGIKAVQRYGKDAPVEDETEEATSHSEVKPIIAPQKPWISC